MSIQTPAERQITTRPDPEIAAYTASVLSHLDMDLHRSGHRGHLARFLDLQRRGQIINETYFQAIDLARRSLP